MQTTSNQSTSLSKIEELIQKKIQEKTEAIRLESTNEVIKESLYQYQDCTLEEFYGEISSSRSTYNILSKMKLGDICQLILRTDWKNTNVLQRELSTHQPHSRQMDFSEKEIQRRKKGGKQRSKTAIDRNTINTFKSTIIKTLSPIQSHGTAYIQRMLRLDPNDYITMRDYKLALRELGQENKVKKTGIASSTEYLLAQVNP